MRHSGNLVALFVVVGERASLEDVPEIEVAQLDLGTEPDVAREQAEQGRLRQFLQFANKIPHARTQLGLAGAQDVVEPKHVALEEPLKVFRRRRDMVEPEEFAHQAEVGASGEFQALEMIRDVELSGEGPGESLNSRTAGVDQRAVNVE